MQKIAITMPHPLDTDPLCNLLSDGVSTMPNFFAKCEYKKSNIYDIIIDKSIFLNPSALYITVVEIIFNQNNLS